MAILLVAPFLRALWQSLQPDAAIGLASDGDVLLFGAIIAGVFIGDSLRFGRPTRGFLVALAACLALIGLGSIVFAIGIQFDQEQARRLANIAAAGPLLAMACAYGTCACLKRAFPVETDG